MLIGMMCVKRILE